MRGVFVGFLFCALTAPMAHADVGERLTSLVQTPVEGWPAARATALADKAFVAQARQARVSVVVDDWRAAAMAEILAAAADHPAEIEQVRNLQSLDPMLYLRARRPIPLATRELTRKHLSAGTLLEAWLFERQRPLARPADAYPAKAQLNLAEHRQAEALALQEGLLTALARTRHPVAAAVLLTELKEGNGRRQQLAAVLLGETGQAKAIGALTGILDDKTVRDDLYSSAVVGLGKTRALSAVERLGAESVRSDLSREERVAVIQALANAGNRYAHQARPRPQSDQIRKQASDTLVSLVPASASDSRVAESLAQAIATVGHPDAAAKLTQFAAQPDQRVRKAAAKALALHARASLHR